MSNTAFQYNPYQVSTDQRSGITNDPNRPDDSEYIVRPAGAGPGHHRGFGDGEGGEESAGAGNVRRRWRTDGN